MPQEHPSAGGFHVKVHLGKFVPISVRQLIERDPTAPALDKREQDVMVLFLDIEGYTSLRAVLDHAAGHLYPRDGEPGD